MSPAAVTVTVVEQGGNVVATGNGTINTAGLTGGSTNGAGPLVGGAASVLLLGPTGGSVAKQWFGANGPASFGTGNSVQASSGSGDFLGVAGSTSIGLPANYPSGTNLSVTDTWGNATFSSLGLTPGTYVWTWGTGGTADSFTVKIIATPPPVPTITVAKKAGSNKRFTAKGGSLSLTGTAANADQIRWNLLKGVTHKVAVKGTKWTVKISPLKVGKNTIQISGWNTTTKKGSKPFKITITRK
jgi:hypothetical protein